LLLAHAAGGLRALLDADGSLVSLRAGGRELVRPAPATRRPFSLLLSRRDGARSRLRREKWSSEATPGGRRFTYDDAGLRIVKSFALADDGQSLSFALEVAGGGAGLEGVVLTGPSGVAVRGEEEAAPSGLYVERGERLDFFTREALVQRQRDRVAGPAPTYVTLPVEAAARTAALGLLGPEGWVELAGVPPGAQLHAQAYDAVQAGDRRMEIEGWASLPATEGALARSFTLLWGTPESLRARRPRLFSLPDLARPPAREEVLENGTLRVVLTDRGAAIRQMHLKRFTREAGQAPAPDSWENLLLPGVAAGQRALTLRVTDTEKLGADPARATWSMERAGDGVRFRLEAPRGWRFEKRVTLPPEGRYDLDVEITVTAPSGYEERGVNFTLVGPSGVYLYDAYRGITAGDPPGAILLERRGGEDRSADIDDIAARALDRSYREDERGLLRAVAVRGAYFVCALTTEERRDAQGAPLGVVAQASVDDIELLSDVERPDGERTRRNLRGDVSCYVDLSQGPSLTRFRLYAGPNDRGLLRELQIEDAVDFGTFAIIGRALMGLMKLFQRLLASYGIAIVLMTMVVRALLAPVSYKTQLGMQRYARRLQKLKPILDELEKKFGSNRQRLNQERLKVMREHKVGFPLGCLTIFLQIPIWYALFQSLKVEFSLRHQPFLWARDLSMPDRVLALPFWPHWLNLLPILMLALWVWQQRVQPTPASDDPQMRAQMKMLRVMPYVFFLFLYNYASALAVYMCVSSLWGIAEGKLVRRAIARLA
ncbi:MAG: YidC/Oxa1 family insertase periplasmic-domain containing protein, partial [Planctomycetota bacterium]